MIKPLSSFSLMKMECVSLPMLCHVMLTGICAMQVADLLLNNSFWEFHVQLVSPPTQCSTIVVHKFPTSWLRSQLLCLTCQLHFVSYSSVQLSFHPRTCISPKLIPICDWSYITNNGIDTSIDESPPFFY